MDSSSTYTLVKLFDDIIEWKTRRRHYSDIFDWDELHISVVQGYVLKFDLNLILSSVNMFDDREGTCLIFTKKVEFFTQQLQQFFRVPMPHQLLDRDKTVKKNELVAAFIDFLVQLLYHKTDFMDPFMNRVKILEKELRFLLTVVGDTILVRDDDEQVENLLAEFEAVANEAGILVYRLFFSTNLVFQWIPELFDDLFGHVALLKDNIIEFTNLLQIIITPRTAAVDSLFIVDSLLDDLEDVLNTDDKLIDDVKDQIKILHHDLKISRCFLKDMKVPRDSKTQIRDVAYEAEYLINSFLVGDAPLSYFSLRLPHVIHKIKLIGNGLQEIKRDNYDYGALKFAHNFGAQLSLQAKRNSEVDDITVGLENEATYILDQLVGGTQHLQSISIFGMPGLGKTTFAKKLYNHPCVNYRFDRCSWCVVSQMYQRKRLLIDILISSGCEDDKDRISKMEEENLVERIYKSLKGRRYLIVMDDIWDSNVWDDLRRCFPDDGNGSRILFTSRNKDVAPPNSIIHALPSLSNEQCWELLEKKVFHNDPCPPQLVGIGKEIATNCCGLPLAVVVIAGILLTVAKEESTWKNVEGRLASLIFDGRNNSMMQVLEQSYKYLPKHLKPCFLYFGALPEYTEIPVRKLKWLWIAEGFIHEEDKKSAESVAEIYLMELIDKSLVMVAKRRSDGGVKACVIHDLLRDLCLKIAEEENFLKWVDNNSSIYQKCHCLLSRQHSLTPFDQHAHSFHGYSVETIFYVRNMKLLRTLDFNHVIYRGHLFRIESLVQLRYLVINGLPASIASLVNLEFLIVKTLNRVNIPSAIVKMMKLRYLCLTSSVFEKDCNNSQPNNLEYLSKVIISTLEDEETLKCSPHLRKLKCKCKPLLDRVQGSPLRYPDLRFLTQLESLHISASHEREMPTEINFPSNIKKLTLTGLRLPWEKINSTIGILPNLEVLKLGYDAFVGGIWETRNGEFQQLRFLKLQQLGLNQWNVSSSEHFPRLRRLVLRHCYNLREIPCEIGEIATMQLIEVDRCRKEVGECVVQIEQEQRDMGNQDIRVVIRYSPHL